MTTLTPAGIKEFPEDSLEKKIYTMVDSLSQYLPVANDRNRLSFCLFKYVKGEGDAPKVLVHSTKVKIEGISSEALADKLNTEIEKIKQESK